MRERERMRSPNSRRFSSFLASMSVPHFCDIHGHGMSLVPLWVLATFLESGDEPVVGRATSRAFRVFKCSAHVERLMHGPPPCSESK
jgi:hypothetical protein